MMKRHNALSVQKWTYLDKNAGPDGSLYIAENIPEYKFAIRDGLGEEFIPTRAEPNATGWDVRCANKNGIVLYSHKYEIIDLGFRSFCPPGYWLELKPRSSSFAKKHLNTLIGTIDECFEGYMGYCCQLQDYDSQPLHIEHGERIGQLIPIRRQEMITTAISNEEIEALYAGRNAERKDGGFGSSGNK